MNRCTGDRHVAFAPYLPPSHGASATRESLLYTPWARKVGFIALFLSVLVFFAGLLYARQFVGTVTIEPQLTAQQAFHLWISSWILVGSVLLFVGAVLLLMIAAVHRVRKGPAH